MDRKEYNVIQNSNGKFLKIDDLSGGYPCFIDDFELCEKYKSRQLAEDFLKSIYVTQRFQVLPALSLKLSGLSQISDAEYLHAASYVPPFRECLYKSVRGAADSTYHVQLSGSASVF